MAKAAKKLLTLGDVAEQTGISYATLVRYARLHEGRPRLL